MSLKYARLRSSCRAWLAMAGLFAICAVTPRAASAQFSDFADIEAGLPGVDVSSAAWGDYDSDGDLDVLLTGSTSSVSLSRIYRNDGGAFVDIAAGLPGVIAGSVAWGDYDNDGDLDVLLTGNSAGIGIISRIYRNDAGVFVDIAAGLPGVVRSSVAWGDYDNDGDLDVLLTGLFSGVRISRIYQNNDGIFLDHEAGLEGVAYSSVAWGDYDNDGDLDILFTGVNASNVLLSRIYRNDDGVFFVDIGAGLEGVGYSSVAWGDYDNDGDLDVLLTGAGGTIVSRIYRNDAGVFVDIAAGLEGVWSSSVAWGDYDNDGDLDVLLMGKNTSGVAVSRIYRNDAGAFVDIAASLEGLFNDLGGSSAEWGDYDNDGDLDILLAGRNASTVRISRIYRNDVASSPNTIPTAPTNLRAEVINGFATFTWDAGSDYETPASGLSYNLRVGTTPGGEEIFAGMADLASGYRRIPALGNAQHRLSWSLHLSLLPGGTTLYWSVQTVDTAFAGSAFAPEQAIGRLPDIAAGLPGLQNPSVAWGDYDNDGDLDALLTGNSPGIGIISRIYRNDGGAFADIGAGLEGVQYSSAAWGDYDNDGDLDVLLTGRNASNVSVSRIYRNDAGAFVDIGAGLEGVWTSSVAWGDYDNDGDLDVLITGSGASAFVSRIYRNDAGAFVDIAAGLEGVHNSSVAWGDYDNDGDLDVLLTGNLLGVSVSRIYRNDGGAFVDIAAGLEGVQNSSVAWGDYDNDGDLDVLLVGLNPSYERISRIYRNDAGAFVDIGAGLEGVEASSVAWGDYDNDGDLDVLLTGLGAAALVSRIYRNDAGVFASADVLDAVIASSAAWGDYDNDGDLDVLLTGRTPSGEYLSRIYRNDVASSPNTIPTAPANLGSSVTGGIATFTWDAGSDNETPASGLSYNLRVGTTPGGDEISAGMASTELIGTTPGGYRRIPALGNAQQRLSWSLDVSTLAVGTTLYWNVQTVDTAFAGSAFAGEESLILEPVVSAPALPPSFALHPSAPNPFNPSTTIRFDLPQAGKVELTIYDVAGRRVRTLVQEVRDAGSHDVTWRGVDDNGRQVASGVYLYRLRAGSYVETRRMTLLK